jgi:protein-L-isoaspartate(D-aspartate) O-methyltransferase
VTSLDAIRRRYAARMMRLAGIDDSRIENAFAQVPREAFAGPPPWTLYGDRETAGDPNDPASLYADVLVALDPARGVNNGSPSLHALMLQRLRVPAGARVLHGGSGAGYYTAILAHLAGPEGSVTAMEYDKVLARRAAANLRGYDTVTVAQGDVGAPPPGKYDRIYINFAVCCPAPAWLDSLAPGGSLVFPLGTPVPGRAALHSGKGAVLRVTRVGTGFAVRFVSPCSFVLAQGMLAGDHTLRTQLHQAFVRGGVEFVQSLRLSDSAGPPPPTRTWFWSPEWSLSYDPPPGAVGDAGPAGAVAN